MESGACLLDDIFERAVAINPKAAGTYVVQGIYLNRTKQYETAIERFKTALELDPDNLNAHYNLALTYLDTKQYELANQHAQRAYALGATPPGLRHRLQKAGTGNRRTCRPPREPWRHPGRRRRENPGRHPETLPASAIGLAPQPGDSLDRSLHAGRIYSSTPSAADVRLVTSATEFAALRGPWNEVAATCKGGRCSSHTSGSMPRGNGDRRLQALPAVLLPGRATGRGATAGRADDDDRAGSP